MLDRIGKVIDGAERRPALPRDLTSLNAGPNQERVVVSGVYIGERPGDQIDTPANTVTNIMLPPCPSTSTLVAEILVFASMNARSSAAALRSIASRRTSLVIAMNKAAGTPLPETSAIANASRRESMSRKS